MDIESTKLPQRRGASVIVTDVKPAPHGGFIHTGPLIGARAAGPVAFHSAEPVRRYAMVPAPQIIANIHLSGDDEKQKPASPGLDPKEAAEAVDAMGGKVLKYGVAFAGVHVGQKAGPAFAGRLLGHKLGFGGDAIAMEQVDAVTRASAEARDWGVAGNLLKLLISALLLFGLGFQLLRIIYPGGVPPTAYVVLCAVNAGLLGWLAFFLFGGEPAVSAAP